MRLAPRCAGQTANAISGEATREQNHDEMRRHPVCACLMTDADYPANFKSCDRRYKHWLPAFLSSMGLIRFRPHPGSSRFQNSENRRTGFRRDQERPYATRHSISLGCCFAMILCRTALIFLQSGATPGSQCVPAISALPPSPKSWCMCPPLAAPYKLIPLARRYPRHFHSDIERKIRSSLSP